MNILEAVERIKDLAQRDCVDGVFNSFTAAVVLLDQVEMAERAQTPYLLIYLRLFYEIEHTITTIKRLDSKMEII